MKELTFDERVELRRVVGPSRQDQAQRVDITGTQYAGLPRS